MSLVEMLVLLALLILFVGLLVAIFRKGSQRVTGLTINNLVRQDCCSSTKNSGEFDINLAQIEQTALDVLTQGFSLEMCKAKVKWHKQGNKCIYVIEVTATKDGEKLSHTSEEVVLEGC